jgi:hypothetical protein
VLCINDEDVLAIEVKSTLSVDDVNEHIERLVESPSIPPQKPLFFSRFSTTPGKSVVPHLEKNSPP